MWWWNIDSENLRWCVLENWVCPLLMFLKFDNVGEIESYFAGSGNRNSDDVKYVGSSENEFWSIDCMLGSHPNS